MSKGSSRTGTKGRSSAAVPMDHCMICLLETIKPNAIVRLWNALRDSAKDAKSHTLSVDLVNGITLKAGFRGVATVFTTRDGFVLRFIVADTSTSNGERDGSRNRREHEELRGTV